MKLKRILDGYMERVPEIREYCRRCLNTERWGGNVVLMIVDASFTSIGLKYFKTVVPKVERFRREFVETRKIKSVDDLAEANIEEFKNIWKNARSWRIAREIASHLSEIKKERGFDDRQALIHWAKQSRLENWEKDPIGRIKGVGINTFQYLRMMGGIDTVMPDKIVKRVLGRIFEEAEMAIPENDIDFVREVEKMAVKTGYKAVELCWMTWLIHSDKG
ncbi:MAG: HhH-GDP family DNA glycosylase [Candidatus Syntropharchaeia archaeon]